MGGRGAYYSGKSKNIKTREYDSVGEAAGIKILVKRLSGTEKASIPTHSNTSGAYIVLDKDGEISYIGFYKDNNLSREIDVNDYKVGNIHAHDWITEDNGSGKPITRRAGSAHLPLTEDEKLLVERIFDEAEQKGFRVPKRIPFL